MIELLIPLFLRRIILKTGITQEKKQALNFNFIYVNL